MLQHVEVLELEVHFLAFFLLSCDPLGQANGGQDKLKEELKNIIDDLNDNLNSMKQQVAQQARQINQLQNEKDMLAQRVKDMQAQAANNKQLKDGIAKLQQQLKGECLVYQFIPVSFF